MSTIWKALIDKDNLAGLRRWLDDGGEIEEHDPTNNNTPLAYAANNGREAMVRFLLDRGADVAGSAAFLAAAVGGHGAVAQLLLPGADVEDLREVLGLLRSHLDDEDLQRLVKERLQALKKKQVVQKKKKPAPKKRPAATEDERGPEAVAWLKKNRHGMLVGTPFRSTQEATAFVKKLYAAGAQQVLVDRDYFTEGTRQRFAFWVLLPEDSDRREAVYALCDKENFQEDGDDLAFSEHEDAIFLCWDTD